jgi:hypothetical protein
MLDVYVLQQVVKQTFKFVLKWQLQRPIQQEILWNSNIHLPDIHVQHTLSISCLNLRFLASKRVELTFSNQILSNNAGDGAWQKVFLTIFYHLLLEIRGEKYLSDDSVFEWGNYDHPAWPADWNIGKFANFFMVKSLFFTISLHFKSIKLYTDLIINVVTTINVVIIVNVVLFRSFHAHLPETSIPSK